MVHERRSFRPVQEWIRAIWGVFAIVALSGCASQFGFLPEGDGLQQLPELAVSVIPLEDPAASMDGFEVAVDFEVTSSGPMPFRHVVQEIHQTMTQVDMAGRVFTDSVTLVEAFRLSFARKGNPGFVFGLEPFQRDRHFDSGYASGSAKLKEVTVERRMRVYPALVDGADWTFYGFAHLPESSDGKVVTRIPANFNRTHQERYQTRGKVVADARSSGREYHIVYRWTRGADGNPGYAETTLTVLPAVEGAGSQVWNSVNSAQGDAEGSGK